MARRVASELFISRLSFYTTTKELEKLFSPFGKIEEGKILLASGIRFPSKQSILCSVRLIKDHRTQRPKGFGFVKFSSELDAQKALKSMNGRIVEGRLIFVEFAETTKPENTTS